jgi:isopentenyl phosphate kinase
VIISAQKEQLVLLKLGGSVITEKKKPFSPNRRAIMRLANEIKKANVIPLIIVHGGGSFGHPVAKQYEIVNGFKHRDQLAGFSRTHQAMVALNTLVIDALLHREVPAFPISPSSTIFTRNRRISKFNETPILKMLDMSLVPVLYGDAVLDETQGFSILSGDQILAYLATHLPSKRIIICLDVDGLYTSDPKLNSNAKFIPKISVNTLNTSQLIIGDSIPDDVTGGMGGKIAELIPAIKKGCEVNMINGLGVNRLFKALKGLEVKGTTITP